MSKVRDDEMFDEKDPKSPKGNKTRGRKKGKKPFNTKKDRFASTGKSSNDPSWYGSNDALLRDAGSYSFNNPLGNSLRITELSTFDSTITYANVGNLDLPIPGVMSFNFIPVYGASVNTTGNVDANAPINLAARGIYAAVRKDNSGAKNYDPSDMMKYLIAVDSAMMMHSWMRRLYGLARAYSSVNRYWPRTIIESMNVDFDDLLGNLANLRYYINVAATKINRYAVPANMPIYLRHSMMCDYVYRDDVSDKSQCYVFTPRWLYRYDETQTPSELVPIDVTDATGTGVGNRLTVADLLNILNSILDPLTASEDLGIISGDLLKALGMGNRFGLGPLETDYTVIPIFDETVLSQIQNLTIVGDINKRSIKEGTTIGVDDGLLYQELTSQGGSYLINLAHPLNLFKDMSAIEPKDVMEATRLTVHGAVVYNSAQTQFEEVVTDCGTELVCSINVWGMSPNTGLPVLLHTRSYQNLPSGSLPFMKDIACFNQHPLWINATFTPATGTVTIGTPNNPYYFDFDNYTIINGVGLEKLHLTALLSLFGVPFQGQYQLD